MDSRFGRGRVFRLIPLWVSCALLGLGTSWITAFAHWILVETGHIPRLTGVHQIDADISGQGLVVAVHTRFTGRVPREIPPSEEMDWVSHYTTIAYGWPVANWGTVFRQRSTYYWQDGVDPVLALNVGWLWPGGLLSDPTRPHLTRQEILQVNASAIAAGKPPMSTLGFDPYERFLPIFPLVGHSMVASFIYGLPFFIWFKWREIRRRGHCDHCDFSLAGLPPGAVCPECGKPFVESSAAGTAGHSPPAN